MWGEVILTEQSLSFGNGKGILLHTYTACIYIFTLGGGSEKYHYPTHQVISRQGIDCII